MTQFIPVDAPPEALRTAYLDGLGDHQEHFLEEKVARGRTWCMEGGAYVVLHGSDIVEFHVDSSLWNRTQTIFDAARQTTGATAALCKSFDKPLLFAALAAPARVTATGVLFRSRWGQPHLPCPGTVFRPAQTDDRAAIAAISTDFFDDSHEIADLLAAGCLHVLELDGVVIGCGTRIRVVPDRDAVDLGMMVAESRRGNGYGAHIIARMRDDALAHGQTPICGCAARNIASWRALLKAGFVDDHRLLRIEFLAE